MDKLKDVPQEQRTARFVCAIALADAEGKTITKRATIEGFIGYEVRGENGFGYDPIFMVPEYNKTTAELTIEEKNEIIKKDKTYGKIICRCEGVTEGEILNAIRTNPKPSDLDGVKRRTRAQMGRCQGGFCSPYIMKLLAKEMGVSVEQVTKKGKDSIVITGNTKEENND